MLNKDDQKMFQFINHNSKIVSSIGRSKRQGVDLDLNDMMGIGHRFMQEPLVNGTFL